MADQQRVNWASAQPDEPGDWLPLCPVAELVNAGPAVPFDVLYLGQTCRAFAVRHKGTPHAYLNRCTHVPMELDWQPNQLFDDTGQWLLCATHGAIYRPDTGACAGGPCRGGLVKIGLAESNGWVHWHTRSGLQPLVF